MPADSACAGKTLGVSAWSGHEVGARGPGSLEGPELPLPWAGGGGDETVGNDGLVAQNPPPSLFYSQARTTFSRKGS